MDCALEAPFIFLLPLLAVAVLSDALSLAMFFVYRPSQRSYQWILLLWLVISLGASVALAVFLLFSYWRWGRIRREAARRRVERIVEFERGLRGNVPQDHPMPSPTTTSTAILFPTHSRDSEGRRSGDLDTLPEIPVRRLSPVRLRDLPSYRRDEASATTLGTSTYDAVVESAEQVRLTRDGPVRALRHTGRGLEEVRRGDGE